VNGIIERGKCLKMRNTVSVKIFFSDGQVIVTTSEDRLQVHVFDLLKNIKQYNVKVAIAKTKVVASSVRAEILPNDDPWNKEIGESWVRWQSGEHDELTVFGIIGLVKLDFNSN
jgi:hypothetical protein